MNTAKRYNVYGVLEVEEDADGRFVRAEDYEEIASYAKGCEALIGRAVDVLARHAEPASGTSKHDTISALYSIFDGPEYRALGVPSGRNLAELTARFEREVEDAGICSRVPMGQAAPPDKHRAARRCPVTTTEIACPDPVLCERIGDCDGIAEYMHRDNYVREHGSSGEGRDDMSTKLGSEGEK